MFWSCQNLTSLDLSTFNTSNVMNMEYMFYDCQNIRALDLTHFSFKEGVNLAWIFNNFGKISGNATNTIPIKVTEDGYKFLKDKSTKLSSDYAQYVKPDGTPWTEADLQASGN